MRLRRERRRDADPLCQPGAFHARQRRRRCRGSAAATALVLAVGLCSGRWSSRRPITSRARACGSCSSMSRRPGWRCRSICSSRSPSAVALVWRHPLAEIAAQAAAPIGAAFTLVCLATGSLWGRPMWGTWWVWDARLTSVLVLFFLYLGYIALVNAFDDPSRGGARRRRSWPWSASSTCRSSNSRSIGGTRCTSRRASCASADRRSTLSMLLPLLVMAVGVYPAVLLAAAAAHAHRAQRAQDRGAAALRRRRRGRHRRGPSGPPPPAGAALSRAMERASPTYVRDGRLCGVRVAGLCGRRARSSAGSRCIPGGATGPASGARPPAAGPIGGGRGDDPQAAAAARARVGMIAARPRRPRWCWPRSTTISCSSTARASWPAKAIGAGAPHPHRRAGRSAKPVRAGRTGAASLSASPTARPTVAVVYDGVLPDLFREGQGVVAEGRLRRGRRVRRHQRARQARREIHAARGRRRAEESGRWQEGGTQGAVPATATSPGVTPATTAAS